MLQGLCSHAAASNVGHTNRNVVFEHSQNAQIRIHPIHSQSLRAFPTIDTFYGVHCFCQWTAKALVRLCGCTGSPGSLLFAYARPHFRMARPVRDTWKKPCDNTLKPPSLHTIHCRSYPYHRLESLRLLEKRHHSVNKIYI